MATGFLHPGAMGASLAAMCAGPTLWCGEGRSAATRGRAERAGMTEAGSLAELVDRCDVIVSICPPAAAETVAEATADAGFDGIYDDANAIAPMTARAIAERFERFVDAGVIGPPVAPGGSTRLYLAGPDAPVVAALWDGSDLGTRPVDGGAGAASAVKVCFAAWTKGTAALLLAVRALARAEGVEEALLAEWATSMPDLSERSERTASATGPKAWRFEGELAEIADAFAAHDLPDGFGRAAAEVYGRLADLRQTPEPTLHQVVDALLHDGPAE